MANRKAAQDAEVAAKTILEKGLLIVHTGTGKGKSTAAFGLCCARSAVAGAAAWCSSSRAPGIPASGRARALRRPSSRWHTLGEGFTWETQDSARDIAAAAARLGRRRRR